MIKSKHKTRFHTTSPFVLRHKGGWGNGELQCSVHSETRDKKHKGGKGVL
jgi:hypothetical protein